MEQSSPFPSWTPSSPAVVGSDLDRLLEQHPFVAIHFWAPWNGHDRTFDEILLSVTGQFSGRIYFASCNVDLPDNQDLVLLARVPNIPALGIFGTGASSALIVGMRSPKQLAAEIDHCLANLRPPPRRLGFWKSIRSWLIRDEQRHGSDEAA